MMPLWYLGIILLCYGMFHLICYLRMFPTQKCSAMMLRIGNMAGLSWVDVIAFTVAEKLINKYELEWKNAGQVSTILSGKGFYIDVTTYLIGKIIAYLMGIMVLLPLCFTNKWVFWTISFFWSLARAWEVFKVFKEDVSREKKKKYIFYSGKLLMGAYFIAQIIVFTTMFT